MDLPPPTHFDDLFPKIRSYNPKVCMDEKVHYKVQSSSYEKVSVGFLSTGPKPNSYEAIQQKYHNERDLLYWIKTGKHLPKRNDKSTSSTKRAGASRAERRRPKQIAHSLLEMVLGDKTG